MEVSDVVIVDDAEALADVVALLVMDDDTVVVCVEKSQSMNRSSFQAWMIVLRVARSPEPHCTWMPSKASHVKVALAGAAFKPLCRNSRIMSLRSPTVFAQSPRARTSTELRADGEGGSQW